MGRVRCVKPKVDAASIGKVAKKKVAKVRGLSGSTVGGIKSCIKSLLAQQFHDHYATGVCWGLQSYGMYEQTYLTWTDLVEG